MRAAHRTTTLELRDARTLPDRRRRLARSWTLGGRVVWSPDARIADRRASRAQGLAPDRGRQRCGAAARPATRSPAGRGIPAAHCVDGDGSRGALFPVAPAGLHWRPAVRPGSRREDRRVKEIKPDEYRVALTPAGRARARRARPRGARRDAAPAWARASPTTPTSRRARSSPAPTTSGRAAEMVVKVKEPLAAEYPRIRPGPDAVHLPAPGAGAGADAGAARLGRDRHRLRDGRDRRPPPAAARADERGRRPAGAADRRALPREAARRPRRAARRRRRACRRRGSSCSAAASSAGTRRGSPSAWRPTCGCSTARSTACASSTRCSTAARRSRCRTAAGRGGRRERRPRDRRGARARRARAEARDARACSA